VADFFKLSSAEKSYLIASVGEKRATSVALRNFWKDKKQEAKDQYMELRSRTELEQHLGEHQMLVYYSNWYYSAIHVAVSIADLQTVDSLAKYFQIPKIQVHECLKFLCSVGLVKEENERFKVDQTKLHLDKNSPLIHNHHLNWKHKAIEAMQAKRKTDLNYLSIISVSRKDYNVLRDIFLTAVAKSRETVSHSKDEIVACYSLDMFELNRFEFEETKNETAV
jgi:uncharacterized protein (TIGR02147 family)